MNGNVLLLILVLTTILLPLAVNMVQALPIPSINSFFQSLSQNIRSFVLSGGGGDRLDPEAHPS